MKITVKCCCGAEASFVDKERLCINPGGHRDELGRKFEIERLADEWLEVHKNRRA